MPTVWFECLECGNRFTRVLYTGVDVVSCSRCGSEHLNRLSNKEVLNG